MNKKCAEFEIDNSLFSPDDVDREPYDKIMEIGHALGVSLDEVPDAQYTHAIAENLSKIMFAIAAHLGISQQVYRRLYLILTPLVLKKYNRICIKSAHGQTLFHLIKVPFNLEERLNTRRRNSRPRSKPNEQPDTAYINKENVLHFRQSVNWMNSNKLRANSKSLSGSTHSQIQLILSHYLLFLPLK